MKFAQMLKDLEGLIELASSAIGIGQEKLRTGQSGLLSKEPRERSDCGSGIAPAEVQFCQEHDGIGKVGLEGDGLVEAFQGSGEVVVGEAGDGAA